MSDALSRLRANRVKVHRVDLPLSGEQYFREPSATDWVRVQQLFAAAQKSGGPKATVAEYTLVPLLYCNQDGVLIFSDWEAGVNEMRALTHDALVEITAACMEVTGLRKLLRKGEETAEKNSVASPNSGSHSDSQPT